MSSIVSKTLENNYCPIRMCNFKAVSKNSILHHLRTVHSSDPRFLVMCGINGCATTSKTFTALYSHIYRHHPEIVRKRKAVESLVSSGFNSVNKSIVLPELAES